ncbi:MAG: RraA family protein, partial [Kiritimatiellia bacterium]|nr:RraA family protein [Kiritimatiellia bacterium]
MQPETLKPLRIPTPELRERYLKLYSGAVNDVLRFQFGRHDRVFPNAYAPLREEMKLAGFAFTVKGAPDITTEGEMERRAEMLEAMTEDSVVVWDGSGDEITAQWGEVMTMAAVRRGCRGALVDGIRDTEAILAQKFPVFNRYRTSSGMLGRFRLYSYLQPIRIGEVRIEPGDWIFGDIDGALCIPREIIVDTLEAAEKVLAKEITIREMVEKGLSPTQVV